MEERAREMSSGSGGLLVASRDGVSNGDASKADLSKGDGSNGGASNVSASHGTEPKTTERNASVDAVNDLQQDVRILEKAVYEVKRVIVGQDRLVERILV